jgi:hypothetical protein
MEGVENLICAFRSHEDSIKLGLPRQVGGVGSGHPDPISQIKVKTGARGLER